MTTCPSHTLALFNALIVGGLMAFAPTGFAVADEPAPPDTCEPLWVPTVGGKPGLNQPAWTLASATRSPDGGPNLYAGGTFTVAGGVSVNRIARWDGTAWFSLDGGMNAPVFALAIVEAESDAESVLYAGGIFTEAGGTEAGNITKWDGKQWSAVGGGTNGRVNAILALPAHDGNGPLLIVGGDFSTAGDVAAANIAAWDGTQWSPIGNGFDSAVFALIMHDDGMGDGPALYAGGAFTISDEVNVNGIAKWNGTTWSPLGRGVDAPIRTLSSFDDGQGGEPALYAGGYFATAGDVSASSIARWDGRQWSPVGAGFDATVFALTVHDDERGDGPSLYAGGAFQISGEVFDSRVARWNGTHWIPTDDGLGFFVLSLTSFDSGDGTNPMLHAGDTFTRAQFEDGDREMSYISRWDHDQWQPVGTGFSMLLVSGASMTSEVQALATFDDGSGDGESLYAGGWFAAVGTVSAANIAKWNGHVWSPLSSGPNWTVYDLVTFDDGAGEGPALYAGGLFTSAGGIDAPGVAKWNGKQWSSVGSGLGSASGGRVFALTVFDDGKGDGPVLIAGGWFINVGGVPFNYIAKWDGTQWTPLGSGMNGWVWALEVFDDGTGPALYAGGDFSEAGGVPANRIAKWDGTTWTPLGSGTNGRVNSLTVFDDGSGDGPALIVGGHYSSAGGAPASRVAKWDGAHWSALGSGVGAYVFALTTHDDGSGAGPSLYVGGSFTAAGEVNANGIARWNGDSWSALGEGIEVSTAPLRTVFALAAFDDGRSDAPALYAGGSFQNSAAGDAILAKWQGCAVTAECARGDLNCDGVIDAADLLLLLDAWGECSSCEACEADLTGNCVVGYADLLELLGIWGAG